MEARKCDRCGKFYINKSAVIDYTNTSRLYLAQFIPNRPNEVLDLCCDCKHDLDEWFSKFNKKEEQNNECT